MHVFDAVTGRCGLLVSGALSRRDSLSLPSRLLLSMAAALLIGVAAQIRFHVPGTPVPVTGQVFAVLLCGVFLGAGSGSMALVFYLGLGYAGLPVFSGFSAGSAALAGVTGGYLLGFVPATLLIGLLSERPFFRKPAALSVLMAAGVLIIYVFGALQFAAFTGSGLYNTLSMAVLPFIFWDMVKALLAARLAYFFLPKY